MIEQVAVFQSEKYGKIFAAKDFDVKSNPSIKFIVCVKKDNEKESAYSLDLSYKTVNSRDHVFNLIDLSAAERYAERIHTLLSVDVKSANLEFSKTAITKKARGVSNVC